VAGRKRIVRSVLFVVAGLTLVTTAMVVAPLALSRFHIELFSTYLTYALVAVGLGMVFGYCGILSLGQFAFFGIGAYTVAMITSRVAGIGPGHVLPVVLAGAMLAGLFGFLLSYVAFSLKLGTLFILVTIAVGSLFQKLAIAETNLFGGINGIIMPYWIVPSDMRGLFRVFIGVLLVITTLLWLFVRSPFGRAIQGIRNKEGRVQSLGYNTVLLKSIAFAISTAIAGLGGALYAVTTGFVSPGVFSFSLSFDAVIWVVIGGLGTLSGPILGTLLVNLAKFYLSSVLLQYWIIVVGVLFIAFVLFLPHGILGALLPRRDAGHWLLRVRRGILEVLGMRARD